MSNSLCRMLLGFLRSNNAPHFRLLTKPFFTNGIRFTTSQTKQARMAQAVDKARRAIDYSDGGETRLLSLVEPLVWVV